MVWSKHKKILISVLVLLLFLGAGILVYSMSVVRNKTGNPNGLVPAAGEITVIGTFVCLPHKDTSGPQTAECAFGLKDNNGRYFGLNDPDPTLRNIAEVPMNVPVEVKGIFTPSEDNKYQSIGVIEVSGITRTDMQQITINGTYVCLPHKDSEGPQTDECAYGIETEEGEYYAVGLGLSSQMQTVVESGDKVSLTGVLIPVEDLDANDRWQTYSIKGVISATEAIRKL